VVFFALLAGWLRERSDSVLAPAVYHAVANVWYRTLLASFR
jgi:membrane protease YdiL (CAAX protease family)